MFFLVRIGIVLFEQLAFLFTFIDFTVIKIISLGNYTPFNNPRINNRVCRFNGFVYIVQLIVTVVIIAFKITVFVLPGFITNKFTDFSWIGVVFGPFCVFIIWYFAMFCNICTFKYYLNHFYDYNPHFL